MFLTSGEEVFEDTAPFDEMQVLTSKSDYLLATLDLVGLEIKYADEADARIQEDCCPQEPFIVYRVEQSTPLLCINQQPLKPAFELSMPVYPNDSVAGLAVRILKELRMDKGKRDEKRLKSVSLFTFIFFGRSLQGDLPAVH